MKKKAVWLTFWREEFVFMGTSKAENLCLPRSLTYSTSNYAARFVWPEQIENL